MGNLSVVNLRCEYRKNPIGTGVMGSCLSWVINSDGRNVYGAVGDWLHRFVTGIDTDEENADYKRIRIKPLFCEESQCSEKTTKR